MAALPGSTWPSLELDEHIAPHLSTSALLIIDVQRDFVDGGASPIQGTSEVVAAIARLRAAFRAAARPVVHVIRIYAGHDVDRVRRGMIAAGTLPAAPDSPGASIVPELRDPGVAEPPAERLVAGEIVELGPREFVVWKPRWSAFYRTRLDDHLRALGVDTVIVAGCNFPNCPRATIIDASERDYRVLVASDAISGVCGLHRRELGLIGAPHTTTDELVGRLGR